MKGFAKAHNHKGGYERWVYEELAKLNEAVTGVDTVDTSEIKTSISNLETAIDNLTSEVNALSDRITALENA